MRWLIALALTGCSASFQFRADDGACSAQLDDKFEASYLDRAALYGPCRGDAHKAECDALGLPSAWAVESRCTTPQRLLPSDVCTYRVNRIEGCVTEGAVTCCPE